ncbi:GNAT family N-acetyltransferase [Telluribacter humicola]|uniref:GNAT family N-acetyltransferase n=1 Tax=Telluribacter humicola TaxID=1720261 RepID=UPI001A967F69|nr:GNAT family N-acetyltransferase [Telluribacter humicola]
MEEVQLILTGKRRGSFVIQDGEELLGEMVLGISSRYLTVYHTEISPKAEGKGLAHQLLTTMVAYAREHSLKVIPMCPYVHAQFKRHPELYDDVWERANQLPG